MAKKQTKENGGMTIEEKDGEVTIRFRTDGPTRPSSSGKTLIVATTGGNKQIGESGLFIGLNAYRYANPK